ncbi:MAG TPA: hypothetical protein VIK93_01590 [Limnochordales bacterium]
MFPTRNAARAVTVPALIILTLALAGCSGDWEQVLRPPRADVSGIQVVAVFPFASWTSDPSLARTLTDQVYRAVRDSGWYSTVIPPEEVESELLRRRIDPRDVTGGSVAREVAAALGADGFIAGIAAYYFEDVSLDRPFVRDDGQPQVGTHWRVRQTTRVVVGLQGQMVNVHTGTVVHRWEGTRTGEVADVRDLVWSSADPPPTSALPSPHRRDVPEARDKAVRQVVEAFTADILPYYEWVRRDNE